MKHFVSLFLLLALLGFPISFGTTLALNSPREHFSEEATASPTVGFPQCGGMSPLLPGPDLNIVNWTSNQLRNPGFEQWTTPQEPDSWYAYAAGDSYHWLATEPPWHVANGTYSGGMQCRAPYQRAAEAWLAQYSLQADMHSLRLGFEWYSDANGNPLQDSFTAQVDLTDGLYWYYIWYFLNGTTTAANSSNFGYYLFHDPPQQWNIFNRNLTADFLEIPEFPESISSSLRLESLRFYLRASGSTGLPLRAFIDDVHLYNATTHWIGSSVHNGGFENGYFQYWSRQSNAEAADIRECSTAHGGSSSMNFTAASRGNSSFCYAIQYPWVRTTNLNQGTLSFWWHLTLDNTEVISCSLAWLSCANITHSLDLIYYLGYRGTTPPFMNYSTTQLFLRAPQFNTTDSWVPFQRNLWQDAAAFFHTTELVINGIYFQTLVYGPSSRVTTLVDDVALDSATVSDAGYEDQYAVGSPVRGWATEYPAFSVTTSAYAGSKAANLTILTGSSFYGSQSLHDRPLNGTRETYLDVMWRLEDYSPAPANNVYIDLIFSSGREIAYCLAASTGTLPGNYSWAGFFNVTGVSTKGVWIPMHRDLVHDYQAVFGSLPDDSITNLVLSADTSGGGRLELLLDDFYLYDDPAPRLWGIYRTPDAVNHNQPVQVFANAEDQDLDELLLHYSVGGGSWDALSMTLQGGKTYAATLPGQPHGTSVVYYVTVNDTWGMTTTALNGTAYWGYWAWDYIPPMVAIDAPVNGATISGTISINVTASDSITGIARVEFRIDDHYASDDLAAPYRHEWNTAAVADGPHTIKVNALDGAGNWATATITVTVSNATPPPPIPGFPWMAVLLGSLAAVSLGLVRRRRLR